ALGEAGGDDVTFDGAGEGLDEDDASEAIPVGVALGVVAAEEQAAVTMTTETIASRRNIRVSIHTAYQTRISGLSAERVRARYDLHLELETLARDDDLEHG